MKEITPEVSISGTYYILYAVERGKDCIFMLTGFSE
jgi:hypothetical protein